VGSERYPARQSNLIITPATKRQSSVDDIEVAQFLYTLLNNNRPCGVSLKPLPPSSFDPGQFTPDRKRVLDALRAELASRDYIPVMLISINHQIRPWTRQCRCWRAWPRFVIAESPTQERASGIARDVADRPSLPIQPNSVERPERSGMFGPFPQISLVPKDRLLR